MKKALSKRLLISAFSLLSTHVLAEDGELTSKPEVRYPTRIIDRPAVIPTGIINIDTNAKLTVEQLKTGSLDVATQFGVVKGLEGQFSYEGLKFNTKDKEGKDAAVLAQRVVKLGAKYNYFNIPHVSFAASASLPIHILDGEIVQDVTLGLPVTFYNNYVAGSVLGSLLKLKMRPTVETSFDFPFWFGVQVHDNIWVMAESSFGKYEMKNEDNQATWKGTGFWKKLPATLTATYAFNNCFDLGANFGFDNVLEAKESFSFGLTFSARAGKIFG